VAVFGPLLLSTAFSTSAYAAAEDHRLAHRRDRRRQAALPDRRPRPVRLILPARLRRDLADVEADYSSADRAIYGDRAGPPRHRDSAIPNDGLDMKTAAIRIHALTRSLGIQKAEVVGHDIGLMVAYAYAAQFPAGSDEVGSDGCLPPGRGWVGGHLQRPDIWPFRFHGPTP